MVPYQILLVLLALSAWIGFAEHPTAAICAGRSSIRSVLVPKGSSGEDWRTACDS